MWEAINTFLTAVREREDILPLIDNEELLFSLNSEQQSTVLGIKGGEIYTVNDKAAQMPNATITGSWQAIKLMLEGKEKLRIMQKNGALKVTAPLRTILKLESLFYLVKADPQLAKII